MNSRIICLFAYSGASSWLLNVMIGKNKKFEVVSSSFVKTEKFHMNFLKANFLVKFKES